MDISFKKAGNVVARLDCGTGRRWNEAKEIDWRLGWKLRFQVSVTPASAEYGLGNPQILASKALDTNQLGVSLRVTNEVVAVEFTLPDCLIVLKGGSWGCSAGGPVALAAGRFHCQALMYAKTPGIDSLLRMSPDGLEFCTSHLGVATRIMLMPRTLQNPYQGAV